jgi:bifunctional non-homologous end joining protein LigD
MPLLEPMLARSASQLPAGAGWAFEYKWDGYRALLYLDRGRLRLLSRRHSDYTARVPELAPFASQLATRRAVLDGELVALTASGRPSFQALQLRIGPRGLVPPVHADPPASSLAYLIFDLLYLDGRSMLPLPYADRRHHLEQLDLVQRVGRCPPARPRQGGGCSRRARPSATRAWLPRSSRVPTAPVIALASGSRSGAPP